MSTDPGPVEAGLGCLKYYSLEVIFKPDVTPRFCTVPFTVQEDLNQAYDVGIVKGIWKPVKFNEYDTLVVPVRKYRDHERIQLLNQLTQKIKRTRSLYNLDVTMNYTKYLKHNLTYIGTF